MKKINDLNKKVIWEGKGIGNFLSGGNPKQFLNNLSKLLKKSKR